MSRVHLAVYDLSRGMASAMSQAILGQRIDGIWHTGIVVFNNEYYFGGGIQVTRTGAFAAQNQMQPVEMQDMGVTNKTQNELEAFLRTINHQYTQATYDLINNNCNNFANTVCNFLVSHGIPTHIVDLPRIVFSTPGGAMLRPMVEGMQNNIRQQQGGGMDPFGGGGQGVSPPMQPFEAALSDQLTQAVHHAHPHTQGGPPLKKSKSPASLEERPLISGDSSTVRVIANKILNLTVVTKDNEGVEQKESALSEVEKEVLNATLNQLTSSSSSATTTTGFPLSAYSLIESVLESHPTCHMAALFTLRLMLLRETAPQKEGDALSVYHSVVRNVVHRLLHYTSSVTTDSPPSSASFSSVPGYAMAVCSLSNLMAHSDGVAYLLRDYQSSLDRASHSSHLQNDDYLLDVILSALGHTRSEVRQMGVTLAYNYTLANTQQISSSGEGGSIIKTGLTEAWKRDEGDSTAPVGQELHPHALQLLCCCLEGVSSDQDITVRRRRLAVVLRIFRAYGVVAADFVQDLGYSDVLLVLQSESSPALGVEERVIVDELAGYYNQ